jgi:tetratricopeptide (TPR) repeat protein
MKAIDKFILHVVHNWKNKLNEALRELNYINADHPAYPFAANMKGVVLSQLGKVSEAETFFKDCVKLSEKEINDLITNIYNYTLNIKNIDELVEYMFDFLDKYDIDLETNNKIQMTVLFNRKDL